MAVDRSAAQQGQTVRLRGAFTLSGSAIDPFQIRQVEIRDANQQLITTITTIVRDSLGQYHVDWPISTTEPATIHFDLWYATAINGGSEEVFTNSFQVLTFSSTTAGSPYVSTDEARLFLPDASEITDAQLAEMVLLAQETIEWVTGQSFLPRSEARKFDGSGKAVLSIKRPIQSVSEARILSCHSGNEFSLIDTASIRISGSKMMLALGNVARHSERWADAYYPWAIGGFGCGIWPAGFQNIQITGEWGAFPTVPRQIKAALGQLMRYAATCDDPLAPPDAAFSSESVSGDRNYTMREVFANATTKNATGYGDVDAVLARFKQGVIVGVV
jgi:hypothetical protein